LPRARSRRAVRLPHVVRVRAPARTALRRARRDAPRERRVALRDARNRHPPVALTWKIIVSGLAAPWYLDGLRGRSNAFEDGSSRSPRGRAERRRSASPARRRATRSDTERAPDPAAEPALLRDPRHVRGERAHL